MNRLHHSFIMNQVFPLESKNDDLPHDDAGDYGFEAGACYEAEEGADGCFEGLRGSLTGVVEFEEEGAEEGTEDHSYRGEDYTGDEADQGSSFCIFAAACHLGEVHRYDIVYYRNDGYHHSPYKEGPEGDFVTCCVGSRTPDIQHEHADPADRSSRQSRQYASGYSDYSSHNGQYRYYQIHHS